MGNSKWWIFVFILFPFFLFGQKYTINGYISDAETGEKLIGANVFDSSTESGTVSNTYGFFSMTLKQDSVDLVFSYIGYQTIEKRLYLSENVAIDISLPSSIQLETVEITADKTEQIQENTQMSTVDVPIALIKKIPALLGEVDVIKALQLLPGVQSGSEGQSGLYVRGGSPDQNLLLLDGVPVYNASHLFGFFSVFNADAINDVKLIKGGFPARYGGRLSSVIDINMKEGNSKKLHGTASIGLIASKLTLEGPLFSDKTTFLLSGRRTYFDLLAKPFIKKNFKENGSKGSLGYYFYDVNAKMSHRFSAKNKLFFSLYTGDDKFYVNEEDINHGYYTKFKLNWGNVTSSLRWNHLWTPKLFSNATVTYSKYRLGVGVEEGKIEKDEVVNNFGLDYISGIRDFAGKIDFDYLPNPNHYIKFGFSDISHKFIPGTFHLEQTDVDNNLNYRDTIQQKNVFAQELALYIEDDMKITDHLKANIGLHASGFYVNDKFYSSLQPRLSMRYLFDNDLAIKASIANMKQYIQLLAFEGVGLPTDLWLPSTERILPQNSWQVAMGVAKTFRENYEISIETYYKKMDNVLAYKDGEGLFSITDWQDRVTQGEGESYGLELFIQRKTGRLTGWIGYTLSWSNRQFEELNFGKKYPYKYDRRNDFSIVGAYQISDSWDFSASWVYGTGNAISLGSQNYIGKYINNEGTFEGVYYKNKNDYRMKSYHRLDFGFNYTRKRSKHESVWSFGAYNAYSHKNPFFIYKDYEYNDQSGDENIVFKQVSLFPIIPYINYKINF